MHRGEIWRQSGRLIEVGRPQAMSAERFWKRLFSTRRLVALDFIASLKPGACSITGSEPSLDWTPHALEVETNTLQVGIVPGACDFASSTSLAGLSTESSHFAIATLAR